MELADEPVYAILNFGTLSRYCPFLGPVGSSWSAWVRARRSSVTRRRFRSARRPCSPFALIGTTLACAMLLLTLISVVVQTPISSGTRPASTPQLSLGAQDAGLSPSFWGADLNSSVGNNATIEGLVERTPIVSLRLPLTGTFDYGGIRADKWDGAFQFCRAIGCVPEVTLDGPCWASLANLTNLESQIRENPYWNFTTSYFVYGNEPYLWSGCTVAQYAGAVGNLTATLATSGISGARVVGLEGGNKWSESGPYVDAVLRDDCTGLSYLNLQPYPGNSSDADTPANMLAALSYAPAALPLTTPLWNAAIAEHCPGVRLQIGEGSPGADTLYQSSKNGPWGDAANALEAVLALQSNVTVWRPWSLVEGTGSCQFGLIYYAGTCGAPSNAPGFSDQWYPYLYLYGNLMNGQDRSVSIPGVASLYGEASQSGSDVSVLLVDSSSVTPVNFGLGDLSFSGQVTARTLSPTHPTVPEVTNVSAGSTFTLQPGEVMVLTPYDGSPGGGGTQGDSGAGGGAPGSADSLSLWPSNASTGLVLGAVTLGIAAAVILITRRRGAAR
jgi:hypothetical protein